MIQRTFERVRRIELKLGVEPSHYEPGGGAARATKADGEAGGTDATGAGPLEKVRS
jgi:hypothetical protein